MKLFKLLLLILPFFILTGCDTLDINNLPDELPDDITDPVLKDPDEDPVDEDPIVRTPLEEFQNMYATFETNFFASNAFTLDNDSTVSMYLGETNQPLSEITIEAKAEYDKLETYYLESMMVWTRENLPTYNTNQLYEQTLIDQRSGTLYEYFIEGQAVDINYKSDEQTFDDYIVEQEIIPEHIFDVSNITTVEKISDTTYEITTTFADLSDTMDGSEMFSDLGIDELMEQEITIQFVFTGESLTYSFDLSDFIYTILETDIRMNMTSTTNMIYREFVYEKISVHEHPYMLFLPETKEEISWVSDNDSDTQNMLKPYSEGWSKHIVPPGMYMFYVNAEGYIIEYTVYDEDGNELDLSDRLQIDETTTFYIKCISEEQTPVNIVFEELDLEDFVHETIATLEPGTITGYNEGLHDKNTYTFTETSSTGGFLLIDSSTVTPHERKQYLVLGNSHNMCILTDTDSCIVYVEPDETIEFDIVGSDIGTYEFSYTFIEQVNYPTIYNEMLTYDEFDLSNPIYLTESQQEIYLTFTVALYDEYYFSFRDIENNVISMDYEVYDDQGTLLNVEWNNHYKLGAGSYYIRVSTYQSQALFYPILIKD